MKSLTTRTKARLRLSYSRSKNLLFEITNSTARQLQNSEIFPKSTVLANPLRTVFCTITFSMIFASKQCMLASLPSRLSAKSKMRWTMSTACTACMFHLVLESRWTGLNCIWKCAMIGKLRSSKTVSIKHSGIPPTSHLKVLSHWTVTTNLTRKRTMNLIRKRKTNRIWKRTMNLMRKRKTNRMQEMTLTTIRMMKNRVMNSKTKKILPLPRSEKFVLATAVRFMARIIVSVRKSSRSPELVFSNKPKD